MSAIRRRLASSGGGQRSCGAILTGRRAILPGRRAIRPGRDVPRRPTRLCGCQRGVAQPGSAPALGAGGPRFESGRPDSMARGRWRDGAWPISALSTFVQIFDTNVDRVTESGREWRRALTASAAGVEARSDRRRCWRAVCCSIAHEVARNLDSDLLHGVGCCHLRVAEGAPVEGGPEVCRDTRFRPRR
jgi:hypothetical protein